MYRKKKRARKNRKLKIKRRNKANKEKTPLINKSAFGFVKEIPKIITKI